VSKSKPSRKATPLAAVPQRGYNTNLASEFYVLSMLYRQGSVNDRLGIEADAAA
jgi:hypothetical protein